MILITEVRAHFLTLLDLSVWSSLALEIRTMGKYLQLYITRAHVAAFCYMEVIIWKIIVRCLLNSKEYVPYGTAILQWLTKDLNLKTQMDF